MKKKEEEEDQYNGFSLIRDNDVKLLVISVSNSLISVYALCHILDFHLIGCHLSYRYLVKAQSHSSADHLSLHTTGPNLEGIPFNGAHLG